MPVLEAIEKVLHARRGDDEKEHPQMAVTSESGQVEGEVQEPSKERVKKISMNMQVDDLEDLREWATAEGTNMSEIIRRALVVYRYLLTQNDRGVKILLQLEGERERELIIRAIR
jgi:hypothetical protein